MWSCRFPVSLCWDRFCSSFSMPMCCCVSQCWPQSRRFDAELRAQIGNDDIRARLRRQLPSNIFVQYLAGPHEVRTGVWDLIVTPHRTDKPRPISNRAVRLLPAPVPAVSPPTNYMVASHRQSCSVFCCCGCFGRRLRAESWHRFHGTTCAARRSSILLLASLLPLLLIFTISTFPGEWLDAKPSLPLVPTKWPARTAEEKIPADLR